MIFAVSTTELFVSDRPWMIVLFLKQFSFANTQFTKLFKDINNNSNEPPNQFSCLWPSHGKAGDKNVTQKKQKWLFSQQSCLEHQLSGFHNCESLHMSRTPTSCLYEWMTYINILKAIIPTHIHHRKDTRTHSSCLPACLPEAHQAHLQWGPEPGAALWGEREYKCVSPAPSPVTHTTAVLSHQFYL